MPKLTNADLAEALQNALSEMSFLDGDDLDQLDGDIADLARLMGDATVESFSQAMILTSNEGVVVRTADGTTFQIQVVS